MPSSTSHLGSRRSTAALIPVAAAIAVLAALVLPAGASAASCPVNPGNATAWLGGSGNLGEENWSNGTPTGTCDVLINAPGDYTVTMTGGANTRSLTLGGIGSTPHLVISDQSPNTNLDAQPAGIAIAAGASVTLTCSGPCGGPHIYSGASPFTNAGTITVDANSGATSEVGGAIENTGTIAFEQSGRLSGAVTNKGAIEIADAKTVTNSGSSCGDAGAFVENDTGGTISAAGSGVLSVINFKQGDGASEAVFIPCGSLEYSGDGASEIAAGGGFNLSGEMREGQSLTVSANSPNTNVFLPGDFTSHGEITLTCQAAPGACSGGSGGGAGFNVAGHQFTNAGQLTVAADSGTGASLDSGGGGTIVNTGTMRFDQTARLSGVVVNKGKLEIADAKTVTNSGSSCGDTGPKVVNDTGGQINAAGSGFLSVVNYEQGNGTTGGAAPVQIPCGSLKYTGSGASTVQVNGGGTPMTGNLASGQVLRIVGSVNSASFVNAGRIEGNGAINGTVENSGVVAPGSSPGTLTVTGSYLQSAGGRLEIEVGGTGAGQFDTLAVGDVATLGGTLALIPTSGFAASAALGDSVPFLSFGNSVGGGFGKTTVSPALSCGKTFSTATDTGAKLLRATVVAGGTPCPSGDGGGGDSGGGAIVPPVVAPPPAPQTRRTCPKGKRLKKGRCVKRKCPKNKKLKKGRCVKKKQQKHHSKRS